MDWNALLRKHADVIGGLLAWAIVGRFAPEGWGIVGLAAGVAVYFIVQAVYPESRA